MPEPPSEAAVQCSALFAAFVEWDKAHYHFLCTNHLEIFSDGSGRVSNTRGHWMIEFDNFQVGIEKLKAANTCVSDGPADGNDNKSSAEGPFAARNG